MGLNDTALQQSDFTCLFNLLKSYRKTIFISDPISTGGHGSGRSRILSPRTWLQFTCMAYEMGFFHSFNPFWDSWLHMTVSCPYTMDRKHPGISPFKPRPVFPSLVSRGVFPLNYHWFSSLFKQLLQVRPVIIRSTVCGKSDSLYLSPLVWAAAVNIRGSVPLRMALLMEKKLYPEWSVKPWIPCFSMGFHRGTWNMDPLTCGGLQKSTKAFSVRSANNQSWCFPSLLLSFKPTPLF